MGRDRTSRGPPPSRCARAGRPAGEPPISCVTSLGGWPSLRHGRLGQGCPPSAPRSWERGPRAPSTPAKAGAEPPVLEAEGGRGVSPWWPWDRLYPAPLGQRAAGGRRKGGGRGSGSAGRALRGPASRGGGARSPLATPPARCGLPGSGDSGPPTSPSQPASAPSSPCGLGFRAAHTSPLREKPPAAPTCKKERPVAANAVTQCLVFCRRFS